MSYANRRDFGIEVARGFFGDFDKLNKFGQANDCDTGVLTDLWDGANGVLSTDLWVPPTTARRHDITSSSTSDDGTGIPGTGMQSVRISGLTSWSSAEVSEDVTLNGTANVATANSYVIIHRMYGLTWGSAGNNVGNITATAQTDGTITAAILATNNQSLMAIYGVPSIQDLYITRMYATVQRSSTARADIKLLVNTTPDVDEDGGWRLFQRMQAFAYAHLQRDLYPPIKCEGPCIIKMNADASTTNVEVAGMFDGFLHTP